MPSCSFVVRICSRPGTSLFRMLRSSRVPALYQEIAMAREGQDYDSRASKDTFPGVSLGSLVVYMSTRVALGRDDVERLRIIEGSL